MNWGKGIMIGMACFMAFIITLVTILMRQKIDLVTDNYYVKELDYNNTFSAQSNYLKSGETIEASVSNDTLVIVVPEVFRGAPITGYLFRPNNSGNDLKWTSEPSGRIAVPVGKLPKGVYELTISGKCNGKPFEVREELTW